MKAQRNLTPYEVLKFFATGEDWRRLFSKVSSIERAEQWRQLYATYVISRAWETVRRQRLERDGHRCACCGSSGEGGRYLQVHHRDYHRTGGEDVERDLVTLCRHCCHSGRGREDLLAAQEGPRPWDEVVKLGYDTVVEAADRARVRMQDEVAAALAA